jgi:archaellum biogenesis ATPase FlaH
MKYLDFLGQLNDLSIVDIPSYVASKTLLQTISKIDLESEDDAINKKLNEIRKYVNIKKIINNTVYNNSLDGASVVYLEKLTDGKIILRNEKINNVENIVYVGDVIKAAILRKTIKVDKSIYIIETLFDTEKVENKFYSQDEFKELQNISIGVFKEKLPFFVGISEI